MLHKSRKFAKFIAQIAYLTKYLTNDSQNAKCNPLIQTLYILHLISDAPLCPQPPPIPNFTMNQILMRQVN